MKNAWRFYIKVTKIGKFISEPKRSKRYERRKQRRLDKNNWESQYEKENNESI